MVNKIEAIMNKFKRFNGVVRVNLGNELLFERAYGYADKEKKVKNSINTKFLTCSITKIVTALAIMKLYEEELLDIDEPAIKYLGNDIKLNCVIKVKHLLCHKSGLKDFLLDRNSIDLYNNISYLELLNYMIEKKEAFYPGDETLYSNTGYLILALIIENISNKSYEEYVSKEIFNPLGMDNSSFYKNESFGEKLIAKGYLGEKNVELFNETVFYGCGNMISTIGDLHKLMDSVKKNSIVSKKTVDLMTEVQGYNNIYQYGYGFLLDDKFDERSIGHSGTYPVGYSTVINRYENSDIIIVVLSNDIKPIKFFIPGISNAAFIEATIMELLTGKKLKLVSKLI